MRLVFICVFCLLTATVHALEIVPIVGDSNAKPKNWIGTDGKPKGIMIDLLDEVSRRTGIKFTYELTPWKRAYELSASGKGAIIGFSKTKERQKSWYYSEPMYFDELVLVTTKIKAFEFNGLESLGGRRVAIKRGASYGDDFEAAKNHGFFEVVETTDRVGQMRMLTLDRVDAVLVSPGRVALESVIAENDWLKSHRDEFIILEPPYKRDPNFLGMPKSMNKKHLIEPINKALLEIREDGTHQRIVEINVQNLLMEIMLK